jgi:outer membrane protein OmpA-like peptidoglycan-associated protein/tetratricopeptide (TPR) repeat protein
MKIIKLNLAFVIALLVAMNGNSQTLLKVKRNDFKITDAGFKEAWQAVKEGSKFIQDGPGTYREARKNYLKAYRYNPNNPELNYMIGISYLYSDDKFESIKYLKKAFKAKQEVSPDIRLMLGRAYHQVLDFDNAILEYSEYSKTLLPKEIAVKKPIVDNYIVECRNGKELVAQPKRLVVLNLGKGINSEEDDYNPVISRDEKTMFFASRRMLNEKSPRNPADNKFYEDIYQSKSIGGEWKDAVRFDIKINKKKNKKNNAAVAIAPENDELFIYIGKSRSGDIFSSKLKEGKWTSPRPLSGKINTSARETSMCLSSNGNTMYFCSNEPKSTMGRSDIYVTTKDENGKWLKPKNIGQTINTRSDEIAVSISDNDSTLFFSSKGHKSMGGYDIFKTTLSETGLWSQPENLGYPINTADDDIFYRESKDGRTAYYSSIRESGLGGKDIYKVIFLGAEKEMIQSDENIPVLGIIPPFENIFFTIPDRIQVDTSITMKGRITDSENKKPVVAKLELIDPDLSKAVATSISDTGGHYSIKVPEPKQYGVEIVAKGYLLYLDVVDLKGESYMKDYIRDFQLEPVEVGAKVILKNIFFEFGKAALKPESYAELDNVVKLLQNNEGVRLEISGHTDNVGSLKTNMKLSEDRAKAVVEYLISKGIASSRLEYKGYAYTQPIAPNTTEAGRAQNRRVEFKVLSK